jgi:molecular chaperone GrpE
MNEHDTTGTNAPDQDEGDDTRQNGSPADGAPSSAASDDIASAATTLEAELANAKAEIAALKDQLLRKAAEFENFRRRADERQNDLVRYGTEKLITELLPVIDDFHRSLKAGQAHSDFEPFYKGVELLSNKLMKLLEARGLQPIKAVGEPFNVDFHDALLQMPNADLPPGTILDEIETGYMLHDKVIRHSKVTVSAERPGE